MIPQTWTERIIAEVGDPNGTVAATLVVIFPMLGDKGANPPIQYLYLKRAALDVRLAEEQPDTDITVAQDVQDRQSQQFDHLQQMREDTQIELLRLEAIALASRSAVVLPLTAKTPMPSPFADTPDLNDPVYDGSPYSGHVEF